MDCILLFLKAPTPGKVKTRLAASIGFKEAAELYSAFVLDWCDRLHQFCELTPAITPATPPTTLRVMYSPPEAKDAIAQWLRPSQWGAEIADQIFARKPMIQNDNYSEKKHTKKKYEWDILLVFLLLFSLKLSGKAFATGYGIQIAYSLLTSITKLIKKPGWWKEMFFVPLLNLFET